MKKIFSILLSLISVFCVAFAFTGCNTPKVEGKFYTVKKAYDNGWLNVDDVKSIACCFYDYYNRENPYSGAYKEPTEKLSNKKEKELKQAYLNQVDEKPDGSRNKVHIYKYYGTYSGNIVVDIWSDYFMCDIKYEEELDIGGIIFRNFCEGKISVYHPNEEKPPIDVRGKFYNLKQAYDNGWVSEDDVKSIACHYYDIFEFEENPYSGLYEIPEKLNKELENEVKQAYLEQIAKYPDGLLYDVEIYNYFGTYNGNVVAGISSCYDNFDITIEEDYEIGGVIVEGLRRREIRVYHIS